VLYSVSGQLSVLFLNLLQLYSVGLFHMFYVCLDEQINDDDYWATLTTYGRFSFVILFKATESSESFGAALTRWLRSVLLQQT